jgi:iron complex outermembrane receptor protein
VRTFLPKISILVLSIVFGPTLRAAAVESEVLVTAPRLSLTAPSEDESSQLLDLVPGGTGLIDADNLETGRLETLKDALDYAPGVIVQPRQGSMTSRLAIRGSGLNEVFHLRGVRVLQDGIPLGGADGEADLEEVNLDAFGYAEIWRGANALALGSGVLGGAVNFVSKTGLDSPAGSLHATGGSWGTVEGGISAAGRTSTLDWFASLSDVKRDGFRNDSAETDQQFAGNLGWRLSPKWEERLSLDFQSDTGQLPGALTKAAMLADPRQAEVKHFQGQWRHNFQTARMADLVAWQGQDQSFRLSGYYVWKFMDHPVTVYLQQKTDLGGMDAEWRNERPLLGRTSHFVAGLDASLGRVYDTRFWNLAGMAGVPVTNATQAGAPTGADDQDSSNAAFYAEESVALVPRLLAVAGFQAALAGRRYSDLLQLGGVDASAGAFYRAFNPKLGLVFNPAGAWQAFANWSRSFEAPDFSDLASANYWDAAGPGTYTPAVGVRTYTKHPFLYLNPQTASTWELGTRGSKAGADWDLAAYWSAVSNELLAYDTGAGFTSTSNVPSATHAGMEMGLTLRPLPGWEFRQNYIWSAFRFEDDPLWGYRQLPGIPTSYYRASLQYTHPAGWYLGPDVEWVPLGYPVDAANQLDTDPYTLWGFKAGWQGKRVTLWVQAFNLGDIVYASTTGIITQLGKPGAFGTQFNPGDGRSIDAGGEFKW